MLRPGLLPRCLIRDGVKQSPAGAQAEARWGRRNLEDPRRGRCAEALEKRRRATLLCPGIVTPNSVPVRYTNPKNGCDGLWSLANKF